MKKPKKNPVREERIENEAIADANGPEEQVMGWCYYLNDSIRFPFRAKCIMAKVVSPLRRRDIVEVRRMATEDACAAEMFVLIRWHDRTMAVPLSQLGRCQPRRFHRRGYRRLALLGCPRPLFLEKVRPFAGLPKAHFGQEFGVERMLEALYAGRDSTLGGCL